MRWYKAYCLEVTVLQILVVSFLFKDCLLITLFQVNTYSFHLTTSGYSTPSFEELFLFKSSSHTVSFLANFLHSFHLCS